ncbi:DUF2232 domain-containing protein [Halobacteriovorax sp. JY17]|uniref:DUF2232 domain-containing protein n=1 Tax=Halobacteriovorax sp. JY17 TaxID=2014617 RepID=UPI000C3DCD7E|nr:DUF2232 domain-containing protein [Halobacteriovorax sp. JY17]PIK16527.1 MAG: hypothetical protein CES88_07240 [Halobacteriovorax sp. JY17]
MTNQNDDNNYLKTSKGSDSEAREKIFGQLTNGKLVFLAVISLLLSVAGPLFVFAPVPMSIAFLLYGKGKTWSLIVATIAIIIGVSFASAGLASVRMMSSYFLVSSIVAFVTARVVWKKENPVSGFLKNGFSMFAIIALIFGTLVLVSGKSPMDIFTEGVILVGDNLKTSKGFDNFLAEGGEQAEAMKYIIEKPKEVALLVLKMTFAVAFVGTFFILWISQFMLMRNSLIWRQFHDYPYKMKDLVRFKVPEQFVYVLIVAMALIPLGTYVLENELMETIGLNMVYSLGIFYFFQGFGIISDALDAYGVFGFFRSVIVILSIFMGYQAVAILGVANIWIDFRKFLKKKNKMKEI